VYDLYVLIFYQGTWSRPVWVVGGCNQSRVCVTARHSWVKSAPGFEGCQCNNACDLHCGSLPMLQWPGVSFELIFVQAEAQIVDWLHFHFSLVRWLMFKAGSGGRAESGLSPHDQHNRMAPPSGQHTNSTYPVAASPPSILAMHCCSAATDLANCAVTCAVTLHSRCARTIRGKLPTLA
jgi:hypothetical protein